MKLKIGLSEIIAIIAICIIIYMLFNGYYGASQQDIIVLERSGPQFVPVFFGKSKCKGPGGCPPKGPKKGPKLSTMPVPKIPKIPILPGP
jgi:hypothetical protein